MQKSHIKYVATKDSQGKVHYETYYDHVVLLYIARETLKEDPNNPFAKDLINYIDNLDHEPTGQDVYNFFQLHGPK